MILDLTILSNTSLLRLYEACMKIADFDNETAKQEYSAHAKEIGGFFHAKTGRNAQTMVEAKWNNRKQRLDNN